MSGSRRDLRRQLRMLMALGAVVALASLGAVALDTWPNLTVRFETPVVAEVAAGGAHELVAQRDGSRQYVVPGTVNGVDIEFLLDTGATDVAVPAALARRLKPQRDPEGEFRTASDAIPGYLVTRRLKSADGGGRIVPPDECA